VSSAKLFKCNSVAENTILVPKSVSLPRMHVPFVDGPIPLSAKVSGNLGIHGFIHISMVGSGELSKSFFKGNVSFKELKEALAHLRNPGEPSLEESSRAMMWRLFLGVLQLPKNATDNTNVCATWGAHLEKQTKDYYQMKIDTMPTKDKVQADPLSGMFDVPVVKDGEEAEDQWTAYEKMLDLSNFIIGDLERLYLGGIPDLYFHTEFRKKLLLDVLLLWSIRNKSISYRQGMHELVAPCLYALEVELAAMPPTSALARGITTEALEAQSYWMFESMMKQMFVLYDPMPKKRAGENQPEIVHFVTALQDKHLHKIDQQLAQFLTDNYVYAQVYGMRWTRLLFGREFPMTHTLSFRVWDWLLACAFEDVAEARTKKRHRYGDYGRILDMIGDFALGMIIFLREEILAGDENVALRLLMRYPPQTDVAPLLTLADRIGGGEYQPGSIKDNRDRTGSGGAGFMGDVSLDTAAPSSARKPAWLSKAAESEVATPVREPIYPVLVEGFARESVKTAPPPSLPARALQTAASVASKAASVSSTVSSNIIGGGRASFNSIKEGVGRIVGKPAAAGTPSIYDPVDPFQERKSKLLDDMDDADPHTFNSANRKMFMATDREPSPQRATPASDSSSAVSSSRSPVSVTMSPLPAGSSPLLSVKQKASSAAVGDKLLDVADALSASSSIQVRRASAEKLRKLADLLESEDSSLDTYNAMYPLPSAPHQTSSMASSVLAPLPAPVATSVKAPPAPPSMPAFDFEAEQAAKKAQRDKALATLLDM